MVHIVLKILNVKIVPISNFWSFFTSLRLFIKKLWQLVFQKKISLITYENTHREIVISVFLKKEKTWNTRKCIKVGKYKDICLLIFVHFQVFQKIYFLKKNTYHNFPFGILICCYRVFFKRQKYSFWDLFDIWYI